MTKIIIFQSLPECFTILCVEIITIMKLENFKQQRCSLFKTSTEVILEEAILL